jgi:hypothetical protein
MRQRQWVWTAASAGSKTFGRDKPVIEAACRAFIETVLKPRFLPEIRPSEWSYPVDIFGKWHGTKHRFVERLRNDGADGSATEFDAPFARLDYVGPDRFDLSYHRHTGQWWCLYRSVPLAEALGLMESQGHFHPVL